jgi:hypothetical protein
MLGADARMLVCVFFLFLFRRKRQGCPGRTCSGTGWEETYVRPVDRLIPARKAETVVRRLASLGSCLARLLLMEESTYSGPRQMHSA